MPAVYEALRLPVGSVSPDRRELGTGTFRAQGRLAGTRLSASVDCGTDNTGVPSAETHSLVLQVASHVAPGADTARAAPVTRANATAWSSTTSGNVIDCPSSGALERRMAELLQQRATGQAPR